MNAPSSALFLFYPLLLERSYGGSGEVVWILLQGLVAVVVVAKMSSRADEVYGARYRRFLKRAGLVAVLFVVVYALASL
jgi:hypothetical protein